MACSTWEHRGAGGNNAMLYTTSGMVARLITFSASFSQCVHGHTSWADQPDGTCNRLSLVKAKTAQGKAVPEGELLKCLWGPKPKGVCKLCTTLGRSSPVLSSPDCV